MTRRTAARAALLATGAVTALVLAGCGGQNAASGGTPSGATDGGITGGQTFIPVTSSITTPATATSATPVTPVTPATTPAAAGGGGSETGGTPECKPANLKLSLSRSNGAAGHFIQALRFTNAGKASCVIVGFPGVSYVTGDSGTQVGAPAERDGKIGAQITLHPGQVASAMLSETDTGVFDPSECKPTATRGFRVYPPDSTASMFVAQSGTGCAGNPPSPQLRVQTIKPGEGSA